MKKKKKKQKERLGVTIDGPLSGKHFPVKQGKNHYFFATTAHHHWCGVFYSLMNKITPLGERVARFSHGVARRHAWPEE